MGEALRGGAGEGASEVLRVSCGQCVYFRVKAALPQEAGTCKRLDHKHLRFALPWFRSYDCGQSWGGICREFEPDAELHPDLAAHWEGYDARFPDGQEGLMGIVVDGVTSVRYMVEKEKFADGSFVLPDGSLDYVEKMYYKRCKPDEAHPLGYVLVHERR